MKFERLEQHKDKKDKESLHIVEGPLSGGKTDRSSKNFEQLDMAPVDVAEDEVNTADKKIERRTFAKEQITNPDELDNLNFYDIIGKKPRSIDEGQEELNKLEESGAITLVEDTSSEDYYAKYYPDAYYGKDDYASVEKPSQEVPVPKKFEGIDQPHVKKDYSDDDLVSKKNNENLKTISDSKKERGFRGLLGSLFKNPEATESSDQTNNWDEDFNNPDRRN
ncbi:MAG: hypothetical protein JWM20_354 [Patescibacteria group bacterium]|nr:hypothetical protein [Patescibacteria group bacterium]